MADMGERGVEPSFDAQISYGALFFLIFFFCSVFVISSQAVVVVPVEAP